MCGVLFGALSAYRSEVEHHLPARSFQIKVKNKRLKRHTCLKALQDKGFACGVLFAQTPHMPPKRHTLGGLTDRAGSMSEPAPASLYPPQLPSTYLTPLKTLLSAVTMGT